ncbi:MAG: response regulator [Polyangiaceae bacterium]
MRSVVFRFPALDAFEALMESVGAGDLTLDAPPGEIVDDGEWLLAVFEMGPHRRATSIAARAAGGPDGVRVVIEPRDRRRLAEFARIEAARPAGKKAEESQEIRVHTATGPGGEPPLTERSPSGAPPAASSSVPPRPSLPSVTGARVLVVDDDDSIRDMVAAMLEAVGLVVTTAPSAEDALVLFAADTFELLVLDWNMPRMTGIELCRTLRQRPGLAALPVLFLTANTSSNDMVEAFAAGADDYVVKPFRAPELGARIFSLLRRARLGASPARREDSA